MNYELTQILLLPEIHSMGRVLTFFINFACAPGPHLIICSFYGDVVPQYLLGMSGPTKIRQKELELELLKDPNLQKSKV